MLQLDKTKTRNVSNSNGKIYKKKEFQFILFIHKGCLAYKKLLYEEEKTLSYFHPDARGVPFIEDHCKTATGFIVGGENAQPKEFPFAARLGSAESLTNINWLCGGTIISNNYVLTAAHCFHSPL